MRRSNRRTIAAARAGLFVTICAALILITSPVRGEEAPRSFQPSAIDAAPSSPVPLAEIAAQTNETLALVRTIERGLEEQAAIPAFESELTDLRAGIDREAAEAQAALAASPSSENLREMAAAWRSQAAGLSQRKATLLKRAAELDEQLAKLAREKQRWENSRDDAAAGAAPQPVIDRIEQVLAAIDAGRAHIEAWRARTLTLQARLGAEDTRIAGALEQVQKRQDERLAQLFVRSADPIWAPSSRAEALTDLAHSLSDDRQQLARFWSGRAPAIGLHLLFLGLIWPVLRAARRRAHASRDERLPAATAVLEQPLALATLLTLLPGVWIYPEMPSVAAALLGAIVLVPTILIARNCVGPSMRPILYLLAPFYLLDQVRGLLESLPALSRMLFLFEMALVVGLVAWLLRPARLKHLSGGPPTQVLRTIGAGARVAFLVCMAAFLFDALGYSPLARLIGDGVLRSAYVALMLYAVVKAIYGLAVFALRRRPLRLLMMLSQHRTLLERRLNAALVWLGIGLWGWTTLDAFSLWKPLSTATRSALAARLTMGQLSLSLGDFVAFGLTVWLAFLISAGTRFVLDEEILPRVRLGHGVAYAISTLSGYLILLSGFVLAVAAAGVDLNRFTLLAGAFGVGLGFGLQNVVNNFASGLILLFERPVRVGDTIQLGDMPGEVRRIGIRSSTVRTAEGSDVVVPNGDLVSQRIVNWTLGDRTRRVDLRLGVAYGSDPRQVARLLLEVAGSMEQVLPYPPPQAFFVGFGDSSLDFELRVWVARFDQWVGIRSELGMAVHDGLRAAGFSIPFPQRDLHVRSLPVDCAQEPDGPAPHPK